MDLVSSLRRSSAADAPDRISPVHGQHFQAHQRDVREQSLVSLY